MKFEGPAAGHQFLETFADLDRMSIAASSLASPPEKSQIISKFHKKKEALLSHSQILADLKSFTCKCRPSTCLSVSDAPFVGQVRSTTSKLKSQAEVLFDLLSLLDSSKFQTGTTMEI